MKPQKNKDGGEDIVIQNGLAGHLPSLDASPVKIHMHRSVTGTPDGSNLVTYEAENDYDMPVGLAKIFVEMGAGQLMEIADAPRFETKG